MNTKTTIEILGKVEYNDGEGIQTQVQRTFNEEQTLTEVCSIFYDFLLGMGYVLEDIQIVKSGGATISVKNS